MSAIRRVAVYWSPGRSFADALDAMTRLEPDAHFYAIVPHGYVPSEVEQHFAQQVIHSGNARYAMRELRPLLAWVERLRRERFDELVVLFDSPRLILLAASTRARAVGYLRPNGTLGRLPRSLPGALAALVGRWLWGHCAYAALIGLMDCNRIISLICVHPNSSRHSNS